MYVPLSSFSLISAYRDINSLPYTLACLYEALRLRDLVMTLPKLVVEDTVIPYTTWTPSGEVSHHTRHIKAGSHIIIDSPASQRNPFHWADAEKYKPSRFISSDGSVDKNTAEGSPGGKVVFTGFSLGQRQCIGKRFAEVEMIAFVVFMARNYRWEPVPLFEGETRQQIEKRMLAATEELSFTPSDFGLKFTRR
jgi:cytochrome P450